MKTILALDQGTTSSRAILFDETGTSLQKQGHANGRELRAFAPIYFQAGRAIPWIARIFP